MVHPVRPHPAGIAQLGERQTEDLKVAGSIPAVGIFLFFAVRGPGGGAGRWGAPPSWQLGRVVKAID